MSNAAKSGRRIAATMMLMAVAASVSAAPLLTAAPGALSPPPAAPSGQPAARNAPPTDDRPVLAADSGPFKSAFGQVEPLDNTELELEVSVEAVRDGRPTGNEVLDFFRSPDRKQSSRQPDGEELRRMIGARDVRKQDLPASARNAKKRMTWTDTWAELNQSFRSDGELAQIIRNSDTLDGMLESYERRVLDVDSDIGDPRLPEPEFTPVTVYVAPDAKPFFKGTHKFGGLPSGSASKFGGGHSFNTSLPKSGFMPPQRAAKKPEKKKRTTNVILALGEFIAFVAREIYNQVWARVLILLAMFAMTVRLFQVLGRRR